MSFDFNVSYSSCWGYSLINTLKLKRFVAYICVGIKKQNKNKNLAPTVRHIYHIRRREVLLSVNEEIWWKVPQITRCQDTAQKSPRAQACPFCEVNISPSEHGVNNLPTTSWHCFRKLLKISYVLASCHLWCPSSNLLTFEKERSSTRRAYHDICCTGRILRLQHNMCRRTLPRY